jgi:hypothetical protein
LKNRGQKESSKKEHIRYLSKPSSNKSFELVSGGEGKVGKILENS